MEKETPILDYASQRIAAAKFPTVVRVIVLLLLSPALVQPFLEYTDLFSPLSDAAEFFSQIAAGHWKGEFGRSVLGLNFFIGIPLVLYHLRMLIFGELSRMESWVGYIAVFLGMAFAVITLGISVRYLLDFSRTWGRGEWSLMWVYMVFVVVIAFGACVVGFLGKRASHGMRIGAFLCVLFAANLLFCAIGFGINAGRLYLGYALALPVLAGTLLELTTLTVLAFRRR